VPVRLTRAALAVAGLLLAGRPAPAQVPSFPSHDVSVRVTLGDDGRAVVREEYALTASFGEATFHFLEDSCATVGEVSGSIGPHTIALRVVPESGSPWTFLHLDDSTLPDARGNALTLRYEVNVRGAEVAVPIVLPAAMLELAEGTRGARVAIAVQWAGAPGAARVVMPRLNPPGSRGEWHGQLLAMPSSVRVDMPAAQGACARSTGGSTGGLEWRFFVFVGTMVVWVPAYLLWFTRRWRATS
jgi:hypothetical protein